MVARFSWIALGLLALLTVAPGTGAGRMPASAPTLPGPLIIIFVTTPPLQVCMGETYPVTFMVLENGVPILPARVDVRPQLVPPGLTVESNGLLQSVAYTATLKGTETLQISAFGPDGSLGTGLVSFIVQQCPYTIEITAVEDLAPRGGSLHESLQSIFNGTGSFAYAAGPGGLPAGSTITGSGTGGVFLTIEVSAEQDSCHLEPPLVGQSPFNISGTVEKLAPTINSFGLLHLNVDVPPIPGNGAAIDCVISGAHVSVPLASIFPNYAWDPTPLNLKMLLLPASGGSLSYPVSRANGVILGMVTITVTRSNMP